MLICGKCASGWREIDERSSECVHHGEFYLPAELAEEIAPKGGERWSLEEEQYVFTHCQDMTYSQMAIALGRTMKAVEHLVRARGWSKRYVRPSSRLIAAPSGLTPADRLLAEHLRRRAACGWAISKKDLATLTGLSKRQVCRSLSRLVLRKMVVVELRRDGFWGDRPSVVRWIGTHSDHDPAA